MKVQLEINMGLANIITLVFIVLKLCGVIHWGWFYVLLPSILLFAIPLAIIGLIFLVLFTIEVFNKWRR